MGYHNIKFSAKSIFDTFITEKDIETMQKQGLTMSDCLLIIQLSSLMTMWENIKKMGFLILTGALSGVKNTIWGLCWILHHAPGYRFQDFKTSTLFEDPNQQKRFVDIWRFLSQALHK